MPDKDCNWLSEAGYFSFGWETRHQSHAAYLAQTVEDIVEEDEYGTASDFDDVVQGLTGVVAYTTVGVVETCQHRFHQLTNIMRRLLTTATSH